MTLLFLTSCSGGIAGSAERDDAAGDVSRSLNFRAQKPSSVPGGTDLTKARLEARDSTLVLSITTSAPPPQQPIDGDPLKGPAWYVRIWNEGNAQQQTYIIGIAYVDPKSPDYVRGKRFGVTVCEGDTLCPNTIDDAEVLLAENVLTARVPLARLKKLRPKFSWLAGSFWNNVLDREFAWGDDVPDQPQSGDKRTVRPGDRAPFPD